MKPLFLLAVLGIFLSVCLSTPAHAALIPWQYNFQEGVTPVMRDMESFHNFLLVIITVISIFVLCLLAYACIRFSAKRNPVPSKTSHHTMLEVLWTTIPILILVVIAIPSFRLLYAVDKTPDAEMTLKVTGYQWYWGYEYPDQGGLAFESRIKPTEELTADEPRLLTVDNRIVVPVDTTIRVLITGADVIHSWAVPAFGIKTDAVPGHINETWMRIEKPGIYYGQCSELCGRLHGFMPIAVEAVSKEEFAVWVEEAKKKFASAPASLVVASNQQ